MAYTLDQWKQLPGLENLTSLDDLTGMSSQLDGYTWLDPSKMGTDAFSTALRDKSYDFGDRRAIGNSSLDYYKNLATAAQTAGLDRYGINSVGPQLSNLYNFEASKYGIPVARFGTAEGAQDMRYIPYELATELRKDANSGGLTGIREFVGNDAIFNNGQLTMLPEEYANQLAKTDWYGTDLSTLSNPGLGYMMTVSQLASIYGGGDYAGAPEGMSIGNNYLMQSTNGGTPYRPFSNETPSMTGKLPWMENQGTVAELADIGIRRVTPEIQAAIEQKIQDYQLAQQNFLGNGMYAGLSDDYLAPYRNAEWIVADPNNSANILLGQSANGVTDWSQLGTSLTDAGRQHLYGTMQAVQQNNAAEAGPDLFSQLVSGIVMAGVGSSLGSLLGESLAGTGSISSNAASTAMGGGVDAAGWGAGSLDPLGASFLDSALSAGSNYLTDPSTYIKAGISGGGDLDKSLDNLTTGALTSGLTGGMQDITSGLTGNVQTDSALGNAAATGILTGDAASAAASGLGSLASGSVASENIGGANSILDQALPGLVGQTVAGTTMTGDIGTSLENAATNTGINVAGGLVGSAVGDLTQDTGVSGALSTVANQLTQGALQDAASTPPPSTTTVLPTTINDPVTTGTAPTTPVDEATPTDSGGAASPSSSSGLSSLLPLMALGMAGQDQPAATQISDDSSPTALPAFQPTNLFDTSRYFGAPTKQLREGGKVMQRYDEGGGVNLSDYGITTLNTGSDYNLGSSNQGYEAFYDLLNQADTGLGSGYYGLDDALTSGANGYDYNTPFSSGSITGVSGLGSTSGLYDYLNSIGADTTYLDSVGGSSTGSSESSGLDYNGILRALLGNRSSGSAQSTQGGVSNLLRSVGLGGATGAGLGALALVLANRAQNNNQASANAGALAGAKPAWSTAPLQTRAMSAPTARNAFTGAPIQRASGGLTQMLGSNNAGPAMGYVDGGSAGQADEVPALLSDGEYVLDADIVSALGDGNNAAGAAVLDQMREEIRRHKRSAPPSKIPPPAKTPQQYLQGVE